MEETRSFGYICPKCGKAVMARRSAFSLAAAAAHIECPCGESDMLIETDGSKFRMWVPCGLCGETHQAECSAEAVPALIPPQFHAYIVELALIVIRNISLHCFSCHILFLLFLSLKIELANDAKKTA